MIARLVCVAFLALAVLWPADLLAADKPHLLVLSIDGMRPDYVTHADDFGLKIPTLGSLLKEGTYAAGVVGVVPTYTYPSHTTIMTGVWPAEHGILNNELFDPINTKNGVKYTDYKDIKVQTVWGAAHAAGYVTANVGWPVTTGSKDIDYLMPANPMFEGKTPTPEAEKDANFDNPPGLREILAADVPDKPGITIVERRFYWTLGVLRRYKPEFMTVHIGGLDGASHRTGPFSAISKAALEEIDGQVAQLIKLARENDPNAYIAIVSDHGFEATEKTVHLGALFAEKGLLKIQTATEPGSWDAAPWSSGGTAAIILRDPADEATRAKAEAVIREAAKNPEYGITRIMTRDELLKTGGYPDAAFLIEVEPGIKLGGAMSGQVIRKTPNTGAHGYLPERKNLHASFFLIGPGVAKGRNLDVVDMRQVAPTFARILKVQLPAAKQAPLKYEE